METLQLATACLKTQDKVRSLSARYFCYQETMRIGSLIERSALCNLQHPMHPADDGDQLSLIKRERFSGTIFLETCFVKGNFELSRGLCG
jgi:hypothetical protein